MKRHLAVLFLSLSALAALAGDKSAFLGVQVQPLNEELKTELGFKGNGVVINQIIDESSAEKYGLKANDILVSFNGKEVSDAQTLVDLIKEKNPKDQVSLKVFSDGKMKTIDVALGERNLHLEPLRWVQVDHVARPWIGIQMQNLNPQLVSFFHVPSGILVTQVEPDSPAERAGLAAGDILLNWQGTPLEESADLYGLLDDAQENDEIQFTVQRRDQQMEIPVVLGKRDLGEWFDGKGNHFQFSTDGFSKSMEDLHKHLQQGANLFEFKTDPEDTQALRDEIRKLKAELESLKNQLHEKLSGKDVDQ